MNTLRFLVSVRTQRVGLVLRKRRLNDASYLDRVEVVEGVDSNTSSMVRPYLQQGLSNAKYGGVMT